MYRQNMEICAEASTASPVLRMTHFDFQHAVFRTPGAKFQMNVEKSAAVFRVDVGELAGVIEIGMLLKNFDISYDSHDGQLVKVAVDGLRYVPDIRPGDSIPSELLTGEASWRVEARHKALADQRLQAQLFSAMSGKEILLTNPADISMFLGQIENKDKLKTCFSEAAVALGLTARDTDVVVSRVEMLARELAYIEALRERFASVGKIGEKLEILRKHHGGDRDSRMELQRIQQLLTLGVQEYSQLLTEADAQTGEILAALKTINRQISYIRKVRDHLHFLLMQWEPHLKSVNLWSARRSTETDRLISSLYRFLAPRFTSGRSIINKRAQKAG